MTTDVTQTEFSYPGDNVTVDWDYVFGITSEEDVKVYVALDGALSSTKISSSLYEVTYDSDTESGSVEYPLSGSPLTTSDKIAVVRETVSKQGTDIKNQINVKGRSLEEGLDNNNRQIQENTNELKRTIKVDVNSSSTPDELLQDIADAVVETQENASEAAASAAAALVSENNASDSEDSAAASAAAAEVAKIEYKGSWSAGTYQINDSVTHGGSSWIALAVTTEEPVAVSANWNYLAEGGTDGTNGTNGTDGTDGIDGTNGTNGTDGADGVVLTVVGGTNITVDSSDPANPIVNGTASAELPLEYIAGGVVDYNFINKLPKMTGLTTPAGNTTRASKNGADSWQAFNGNTTEYDSNAVVNTADWLDIQTTESIIGKTFAISGSATANDNLESFKLQGSNDGSSWTDIETFSGPLSWTSSEIKTFDISSNTTSYSDYRIADPVIVAAGFWKMVGFKVYDVIKNNVSVTSGKCRNIGDTADITIAANAAITTSLSASTTYYVNVDSSGVSTISTSIGTGTNRMLGSFKTDSNSDIIPFTVTGSGDYIKYFYTEGVKDINAATSASFNFSVPETAEEVQGSFKTDVVNTQFGYVSFSSASQLIDGRTANEVQQFNAKNEDMSVTTNNGTVITQSYTERR